MIQENKLAKKSLDEYKVFLGAGQIENLKNESKLLQDKKIVHINSTSVGGGVSELLKSLIPLEQDLGIKSRWFSLSKDEKFFEITKKLHNSLQGSETILSPKEKEYYLDFNKRLSEYIKALEVDILIIHDPQPLGLVSFLKDIPIIFRIHIDLTAPNKDSLEFLSPLLKKCSVLVFTSVEFVPLCISENPSLKQKVIISPPAIDPLSDKNKELPIAPRQILNKVGIDTARPIMTQVSRFDPWKDPLGVIQTYRIIKKSIPTIQLVLSGIIEASDDPEAKKILQEVQKYCKGDQDIHIFSDIRDTQGYSIDIFINALQRGSDVILQKSLREGFALTVTEAMWKEKSVVGGNVGGIKLQIKNAENGFLVTNIQQAAEIVETILYDSELRVQIGQKAKESVHNNFLITRFLEDEITAMILVLSFNLC